MGTGASSAAARRQWRAVDEANASRKTENEEDSGKNIGGVARLMEAKSRFLKTRQGREGTASRAQKEVEILPLFTIIMQRFIVKD